MLRCHTPRRLLLLAALALPLLSGGCAAVVQIAVQAAMETTIRTAHYAIVAGSREDKVRGYASVGFTAARPDATRPPSDAVEWLRAHREAFRDELTTYNKARDLVRGPGDNGGERVGEVHSVEWIVISDARLDQLSAVIEYRVGQRDFITATRTFVLQWQGERLAILDHFGADDVTLAAYLGLPPSPADPVAVAKAGPDSPGAIATAPTPSALATQPDSTASAGTTTSSVTPAAGAMDLAAAQGSFDAWLQDNRKSFEVALQRYLRRIDLHSIGNGAQTVSALSNIKVLQRSGQKYLVEIGYTLRRNDGWGESSSFRDRFQVEIVNDALTAIELASSGEGDASAPASDPTPDPTEALAAAQVEFDGWLATHQEAFMTALTRVGRAKEFTALNYGIRKVSAVSAVKVLERRESAFVVQLDYDTTNSEAYISGPTRGTARLLVILSNGELLDLQPAS